MRQLIYVSAAAQTTSATDLADILESARRNNPRCGLTGMLLHIDGGFLQLLEGPWHAVQQTYERICRDERHDNPRILLDRPTDTRLFPDWTMGFERPLEGHRDTGGMFEATRAAVEGAVDQVNASDIAVLLRTFYRVNKGQYAA